MTRFAINKRSGRILLLGVSFLITGLAAPAADTAAAPKPAAEASKQKTVQMRITGMTCPACARGLEASFRKMAGVEKATIDYAAGQAVVTFDPAKQSTENLSKLVADCGYQVKTVKVL